MSSYGPYAGEKTPYIYSTIKLCQRLEQTIRAKMIGGGDPFYLKFWVKLIALKRNHRFSVYFRS